MIRALALLPLLPLLASPAAAQTTVPGAAEAPAQTATPGAAEAPAPPEAPAAAPPAPPRLTPGAPPSVTEADLRALNGAPLPGLESRAEGGWRLRFPGAGSAALPAPAVASLGEIGRRLAALPAGRVTLIAQASGPANDVSVARRMSLARGLAVKQALVAGGLDETRIDVRPAGRTEEVTDAVDVLPPAPPRETRPQPR